MVINMKIISWNCQGKFREIYHEGVQQSHFEI